MTRKDRRKAATKAKAMEMAATNRAWSQVQKGLSVTQANVRGRVVYVLNGGVRK